MIFSCFILFRSIPVRRGFPTFSHRGKRDSGGGAQCQAQGKQLISLMRGEPDLPTPPHIVEASIRALRNGRTTYPDNRGEKNFREAVARKLERDNRLRFDPRNEVLATTGATLGIYAALMAMIDEGDEVLLPDPVYDAYQSPIHLAGGRVKTVASEIREGRFAITEEALEPRGRRRRGR